jgi:NADPH:quinone reductase-like Zn-dependent oxidoreductase
MGGANASEYPLTLIELAELGAIRPVIDRRYPLEQTAEAHRYVETWRKRGSVVIEV